MLYFRSNEVADHEGQCKYEHLHAIAFAFGIFLLFMYR